MPHRQRAATVVFVAASALALLGFADAPQQHAAVPVPARFSQILTKHFQFSATDLASVGRGTVVVKSLPAAESREISVAGAFWCDVPLDYFLARAGDIVSFKRVKVVQQIGVFAHTASAGDLAKLTLEPADVEILRGCKAGDCGFRLDRAGFERLRKEVVWSAPDASAQTQRIVRELIAGYVAAYQQRGNAALIEYADDNPPTNVGRGIDLLLNRSLWLHEAVPGLRQYADAFPRD